MNDRASTDEHERSEIEVQSEVFQDLNDPPSKADPMGDSQGRYRRINTDIQLTQSQRMRAQHSEPLGSRIALPLAMRLMSVLLIGFFLSYFKTIFVPLTFSIILVFLLSPIVFKLNRIGTNFVAATLLTHAVTIALMLLAVIAFTNTLQPLSESLPKYRGELLHKVSALTDWVNHNLQESNRQIAIMKDLEENILPQAIRQGVKVTQYSLKLTLSFLGDLFLTMFFSMFIFLEIHAFGSKMREAYGDRNPLMLSLVDIGLDVRAYVVAKTLTSLLTAGSVYILLKLTGVDSPFLWAMLTFPLNFIPTVGVIIAALPPILIAIIDPNLSTSATITVIIGLGVINTFIGSVVEPNYVGQKVQLSPLVVFLSMLLWAQLWGPVGMILSIPIMVSVKVICSHVKGLEPIAILMRG